MTDLLQRHQIDQQRRGLQPTTIGARAGAVRAFERWLGDRDILTATREDVELYLDSRRIVEKTRYCIISHLHVFYEWAIRSELTTSDPTTGIVRPRLPRRLPRPIVTADLDVALAMAPPLERAVLALAAYAGLRCIEISRLTREDVLDMEEPPVIVAFGKGSKERIVPLHPEAWRALRLLPMPKSGPVFRYPSGPKGGSAMSAWKVSHLGNEYLDRIGTDASMHQLRHWFGTHLYRTSGHDLLLVAALMGHENPATTTIYARYDRAGARAAVEALTVNQPPHLPESSVPPTAVP